MSALWIASFIAALWLIEPSSVSAQDITWDRLSEGLHAAVWEPGARCEDQVPAVFIVRVDPERFRFSVYHFRDEGLAAPLTISEWQHHTGASVLFNAGQFREDYSYLGLLFKDGRSLGTKRHPRWQGLFLAEPMKPGLPKARVLDMALEPFPTDQQVYREAAQSFMLLDRNGKPRVRQTGKRAHQTVVGEDQEGHILLIKTSDKVALWELAECLRDEFSTIRQAMAMDGGASSDLLIGAELVATRGSSEKPLWHSLVDGSGMAHILLPSVIGVRPRGGS